MFVIFTLQAAIGMFVIFTLQAAPQAEYEGVFRFSWGTVPNFKGQI